MSDRIDSLVAEALRTGEVPPGVTDDERSEVLDALAAAGRLREARRNVDSEARAAMATARARFQRFVAEAERPAAPGIAVPRQGWFARNLGRHRVWATAGAAVAVGVLAVIILFGSQALTSGTESAEALTPDDYVQVQGVVSATNPDGSVTVASDLGTVTVAVSDMTNIADDSGAPTSLKAGDTVLIGGIVKDDKSIAASTLAVARAAAVAPRKTALRELKKLTPGLSGRIELFAISGDGSSGTVLIETAKGDRYVIHVDAATAAALINRSATAVGTDVTVSDGAVAGNGTFALAVVENASPTPGASAPASASAAGFAGVRGVIVAREANVVRVMTTDGRMVNVVVRANTRIVLAGSGLTAADLTDPKPAIGHAVAVTGGREGAGGRIIADVLVIGPKPAK